MAVQRQKSIEDMSRQVDRILTEHIRRRNNGGTPNYRREARVKDIYKRYRKNILKSKQGKADYKKMKEAVKRNGSAPREAEAMFNRKYSRSAYMSLIGG